jgi:hypothetical protein
MNTKTKLRLAGTALIMSVSALPASAAPWQTPPEAYAPFLVAAHDDSEFDGTKEARKAKKQEESKKTRKHEKEKADEEGYGYGYERRQPRQDSPDPHFIDRKFH